VTDAQSRLRLGCGFCRTLPRFAELSGLSSFAATSLGELALLRLPECEVNVVPLINKDSLEMTDQDRVLMLAMVRGILKESAPIVITRGTDTMVETGLYLKRALPELEVPIVLTGAMTPLGFEGSDTAEPHRESPCCATRAGRSLRSHAQPRVSRASRPQRSCPRSLRLD
jgi:L-asparaginase/Glu-tRNA(Gln) amidotransferase subunit D